MYNTSMRKLVSFRFSESTLKALAEIRVDWEENPQRRYAWRPVTMTQIVEQLIERERFEALDRKTKRDEELAAVGKRRKSPVKKRR